MSAMPGDTQRTIWRAADLRATLAAAALAATHYEDESFRRGYLAALAVVATAHGIDWQPAQQIVDAPQYR